MTTELIKELRRNRQMSPHATLTVDALFSSFTKPLNLVNDSIFLCVSTKAPVTDALAYNLPHGHSRLFSMGRRTIVVSHDSKIFSQINTVYEIEFSKKRAAFLPQAAASSATDAGLVHLSKLAEIDPTLFARISAAFANQSTGASLAANLSAIGNTPVDHVRQVLERSARSQPASTPSEMAAGMETPLPVVW